MTLVQISFRLGVVVTLTRFFASWGNRRAPSHHLDSQNLLSKHSRVRTRRQIVSRSSCRRPHKHAREITSRSRRRRRKSTLTASWCGSSAKSQTALTPASRFVIGARLRGVSPFPVGQRIGLEAVRNPKHHHGAWQLDPPREGDSAQKESVGQELLLLQSKGMWQAMTSPPLPKLDLHRTWTAQDGH